MGSPAPVMHNPAKLYDDEISARKQGVKTPAFAPKDKLEDFRKEPQWLLPELRQWESLTAEDRMARVRGISENKGIEKPYKDRCLRWALALTPVTDRATAVAISNIVWPKEK